MKDPRLLLVGAVIALAAAGCSATVDAPTSTPAIIMLPSNQQGAAPAGSARTSSLEAGQAAAPQTQAPAITPSPTPTYVLRAPLPATTPAATATAAARPATVTPVPATPAPAAPAAAVPAPAANPQPALGGRIVLQQASGGNVIAVNPDGTAAATLSEGLDPSWSPDGKKIAFTRWSEPQGIYVMNADGSDLHMVYHINSAKSPVWSPDGSKLAFVWKYQTNIPRARPGSSPLPEDFWRIGVIDLATGAKSDIQMDPDLKAFDSSWGRDGRLVYKGVRGLYVTTVDGAPVQITSDPAQSSPVWSPDGKQIVFTTNHQDHWDIGVVDGNGSGLHYLTSAAPDVGVKAASNVAPTWSPDGKNIIYLSDKTGDWRIYIMNADGSGQRQLLDMPVKYDYAAERVMDWKP